MAHLPLVEYLDELLPSCNLSKFCYGKIIYS